MRSAILDLDRRGFLIAAASSIALPALAAPPANGRLAFAVFRNGERIGDHAMTFTRTGGGVTVNTDVSMAFKIGPLKVDYAHEAKEVWDGDAFQSLETSTVINGKRETVSAARKGDAVSLTVDGKTRSIDGAYAPLTHWNSKVLSGAMFNPQNGKLLKVTASRNAELLPGKEAAPSGSRWSLRGQAEIDDWYDSAGVWNGLRGRLPDRSIMEYKRA